MLFSDYNNFFNLWLFLTFRNDSLLEISSYLYSIIGTVAIFQFLRRIGNTVNQSIFFALLYYYGNNAINFFSKNFTGDVQISSLTIISLYLLYTYMSNQNRGTFLFFTLSNGLLFGSKSSGVFCTFLIYVFALFLEINSERKKKIKNVLTKYSVSILICILVGGFFYLRNLYYFHNPLYGKEINFFNLFTLAGMDPRIYSIYGINLEKTLPLFIDTFKSISRGDLGPQFLIFYFPSLLILFVAYRKQLKKEWAAFILFPIFSFLLFLIIMRQNDGRYFYSLSFTGILSLGILSNLSKKQTKELLLFLVAIFIIYSGLLQITNLFENNYLFDQKTNNIAAFNDDHYYFKKYIPQRKIISYLLPENYYIYPLYGRYYENKLLYVNTSDEQEIINQLKDNQSEYFLASNFKGDSSSIYYKTSLKENKIEFFTDNEAKKAIDNLTKRQVLIQIGSSPTTAFYKINQNSL